MTIEWTISYPGDRGQSVTYRVLENIFYDIADGLSISADIHESRFLDAIRAIGVPSECTLTGRAASGPDVPVPIEDAYAALTSAHARIALLARIEAMSK